jgi:transaldolase/glucose-6-phosphate isomerase
MAFLEESPEVWNSLVRLRTQLESRIGIPVQLSFGPRYLHYLGQVYKGGPAKGLFVILTAESGRDIPVPGAGYSFGQLQMALARGDFEALYQRDQQVLWLHFAQDAEQGFSCLDSALALALAHLRRTA